MGNEVCCVIKSEIFGQSIFSEHHQLINAPSKYFAQQVKAMPEISPQYQKIISDQAILSQYDFVGLPIYKIKLLNAFYQGNWFNKLPHGLGRTFYKKEGFCENGLQIGDYFEGSYFNGTPQGQKCLLISSCGSKYVGGFQNGLPSGQGSYTQKIVPDRNSLKRSLGDSPPTTSVSRFQTVSAKQFSFQGEWENGLPLKGIEKYPDGTQYKGQFKNGLKQGQGQYKCSTFIYEGQFSRGKPHGKGTYRKHNKSYSSEFINGRVSKHSLREIQRNQIQFTNLYGTLQRQQINEQQQQKYQQQQQQQLKLQL